MPWSHIVLYSSLSVGASLLFLTVLFRPLEMAFPARAGQKFFRRHFWLDLCFLLGQYLLWGGIVFAVLIYFGDWIGAILPASFRAAVAAQPWWLQAVEVVVLSDFFIYWGHRLQHNNAFLWRFHSVHHTAEHLDWLAAHREHPLDTIYTMGLINLPAFILGFPVETLAGLIAFRGIWAIYIHSNVRLPIRPVRWLIGAPELHHWHHDKDRNAGNYANISPVMDLLFGTYVCPDHEPAAFGIHGRSPNNYVAHMINPLLPRRVRIALALRWRRLSRRRAAGSTCFQPVSQPQVGTLCYGVTSHQTGSAPPAGTSVPSSA